MTKRVFGKAIYPHLKFNNVSAKVFLYTIIVMVGFVSIPPHKAFAFWNFLDKEGKYPQHQRITDLIRWPNKHDLFQIYGRRDQAGKETDYNKNNEYASFGNYSYLGVFSEQPDAGKSATGHDNIFNGMDEKKRALRCYKHAIEHYDNYLRMNVRGAARDRELRLAAQELGHAYHYFEDIGDFTDKGGGPTKRFRTALNGRLTFFHYQIERNYSDYQRYVEEVKRSLITPSLTLKSIVQALEHSRTGAHIEMNLQHSLLRLIAYLELINDRFLAKESPD